MKIMVLGVGMQGKTALHDLVSSKDVTEVIAADKDVTSLKAFVESRGYGGKVRCERLDAGDRGSIDRLFSEKPDVVIDLLPVPCMNEIARAAVRHGTHLVNTFYVSDEIIGLAHDAHRNNVTILPEFGLDPGIDLVLLGEALRPMDSVDVVNSYGAGLPELEAVTNPLKYKITWILDGVLKSYYSTGRVVRNGKVVEIRPDEVFHPHNVHEIEIKGLGKLEAFPNGDAFRYSALLGKKGQNVKEMGRYTLRWPGHCSFWKKLVDLHFLDNEPVRVDGVDVDRKRFLGAVLGPHLRLGAGERDLAIVRIEVVGMKGKQRTCATYQVIDRRDVTTGFTAMSRTVGYTASIGAQMIASGKITKRGLLSPLSDVPYELLVRELEKRGVEVSSEIKPCG